MPYLQVQRHGAELQELVAKLPEGADPLRPSVEPLMPMVLSYETQK